MTANADRRDENRRPLIVIWEPTRACDLACLPCRTAPQPGRGSFELSTYEGYKLIEQVAELGPESFVLSGGDPLKRSDLFEFINYASRRGLGPSITPSATPLLTREAVLKMKSAGLARIGLSLDASSATAHDGHRGIPGSWALTVDAAGWAREAGLPVQILTTVTRENASDLSAMATLLEKLEVSAWLLFFLVPTGRRKVIEMLTAWEVEEVFGVLWDIARDASFEVRPVDASHYRRFELQQLAPEDGAVAETVLHGPPPESRAFVFISHTGEVYPSSFLPLPAGNVRHRRLADIYRHSPLFASLRDPEMLKGKCGVCEYRQVCGGSRARAYALTRDPLAEEPLCVYLPATLRTQPHPELRPL